MVPLVLLPPLFCLICGRRKVDVARYRMICIVLLFSVFHFQTENEKWKSPRDFRFPFSNQKRKSELWNSARILTAQTDGNLTDCPVMITGEFSCHTWRSSIYRNTDTSRVKVIANGFKFWMIVVTPSDHQKSVRIRLMASLRCLLTRCLFDLLMLQLLRPNASNLPCLYSTFDLEYPLVLSRFCSWLSWSLGMGAFVIRLGQISFFFLLISFIGVIKY